MVRRTSIVLGITAIAAVLLAAAKPGTLTATSQTASKSSTAAIPAFQVDPYWPKPLPNDWLVGNVVGVAVDSKDNVWITHRPRSQAGAEKTPPVLAFDQAGNLIQSWGGKDAIPAWGTQEHGLYIDYKDNVWVGFGGGLPYDPKSKATLDNANVLKLTPKGALLLEVGKFGMGSEGSNSTQYLGNPTDVYVDPKTDEAYITDGYINHRIIVVNATTGAYKRLWGAFGHKPDDTPMPRFSRSDPPRQQFDTPHCITMSNDLLLYVCDRGNQRSGVQGGRHVRQGRPDQRQAERRGDRRQSLGHRDVARPAAEVHLPGRRWQPQGPHPAPRNARGGVELRPARSMGG